MRYTYTQPTGTQVSLHNQGAQTVIAVEQSTTAEDTFAAAHQATFTLGTWIAPPTLFRVGVTLLARIETARGDQFLRLSDESIQRLAEPPSLAEAEVLLLTPAERAPLAATTSPTQPTVGPSVTISLPPQAVPAVTTAIQSATNVGREAVRAATQAAQTTSLPTNINPRSVVVPRALWSILLVAFILPFVTMLRISSASQARFTCFSRGRRCFAYA